MVAFAQLRDAQPRVLAEAAENWDRRARAAGRAAAEVDADWPDRSVEILTGEKAHNIDAADADTADIGRRVDSGQVVTVSTEGSDDMYAHSNDSGNLVGGHAYYVKDVLPDGRVVLGNPWGPNRADPEVTLTQEEIRQYGTKVTMEG